MTEDELYRASTQYRLWSFTPESLASLRHSTNAIASQRVRAAIKRARESPRSNDSASKATANGGENDDQKEQSDSTTKNGKEIECLTVEEEQKLVGYYCVKCMGLSDFCSFPTNVKATAVQYLKRFYLSNSPMTYHPKSVMPCALFLATKIENHYTPLKAFAAKVPKTTPEDIIAPEFVITQGLRFTFDVRHPFRGLEGGFMELTAVADGKGKAVGLDEAAFKTLPPRTSAQGNTEQQKPPPSDLKNRIRNAHAAAKDILKTSAQLTDAYFMYTPSQIWLAALYIVDEPLARAYLDAKFPTSADSSSTSGTEPQNNHPQKTTQKAELKIKLLATIHRLATLLQSQNISETLNPTPEYIAELKRIDKKLYTCRNPERMDLIEYNQSLRNKPKAAGEGAADEDGDDGSGPNGDDEDSGVGGNEGTEGDKTKVKKKRRLENDGDVFGGPLK